MARVSLKGMLDDACDAAEKLRAQIYDLADIAALNPAQALSVAADDGLPHGYWLRLRELTIDADDLANGLDRLSTEMRS